MTIPQQPPDREIPEPQEPGIDIPGQDDPMPETPPDEYPDTQEPDYRAPGEDDEPPMQA
jgi:hypothetical protein